jgi:transcriptional regulator with XRE-family HTH domain
MSFAPDTDSAPALFNSQHVPTGTGKEASRATPSGERTLHRLAEIRHQQNLSYRSVARRLGTSIEQVRQQEKPASDLPLSELYRWQEALGVPVADLLVEMDEPLSEPIQTRARLVRVMKTVRAIKEGSQDEAVLRLAETLETQLIELMPELKEVAPWHTVGQRRTQHEMGRIVERTLPETFFTDGWS